MPFLRGGTHFSIGKIEKPPPPLMLSEWSITPHTYYTAKYNPISQPIFTLYGNVETEGTPLSPRIRQPLWLIVYQTVNGENISIIRSDYWVSNTRCLMLHSLLQWVHDMYKVCLQ